MQLQRNKTFSAITIILMLAAAAIAVVSPAEAHTPAWVVPTYAYISVSPTTQQAGQPVLLIVWLDKYPPTANGAYGDRWQGWTIAVTAPDGTKQTLTLPKSDPVGSGGTFFTPTQTGTYTFVMNFPGQTLTNTPANPAGYFGIFGNAADFVNDTYQPSTSHPATLKVQQQPVPEWPVSPLPTGYWSRPINAQNQEWATIASNWLAGSAGTIQEDGLAPLSAHVVWTKPLTFGGIVSGTYGGIPYYDGYTYEAMWSPPVVINGNLYYNYGRPPQYGFYCVNLQTGQTVWYQNNTQGPLQGPAFGFIGMNYPQLSFGQLLYYDSPNQAGVLPYLWSTYTDAQGNTDWAMYDAVTGNWICTIVGVPQSVAFFGASNAITDSIGSIVNYIPNLTTHTITVWNSTACIQAVSSTPQALFLAANGYWMWRPPLGGTINATLGITGTYPLPSVIPTFASSQGIDNTNQIMLFATNMAVLGQGTFPSPNSFQVSAISLAPGSVGQLLWNEVLPWPAGNVTLSVGAVGSGAFAIETKETMQWYMYNLKTGNLMWGPSEPQGVWDMYGMSGQITLGKLITDGYGGVIYAYDLQTGTIDWTFKSPDTYAETPYGQPPTFVGPVAYNNGDPVIYTYQSEHSPTKPYERDALLRCINATDGTEIFSLEGWWGNVAGGGGAIAIADGYIADLNTYDNQIYCIGKGQTATTVSTSPVIGSSSKVLIQGTVTDQSPGAKGTPAIADAYMTAWMQYLYEQQVMPTNVTGVPVTLTAFDPNGNTENIGTVTSDASGNYAIAWTPPVPGLYKVTATFCGTNSYFSSTAETALYVSSTTASPQPTFTTPPTTAPSTATPQLTATPTASPEVTATPVPPPSSAGVPTTYIVIAVVAIIVVVAAAALALRRRK